MARLGQAHDARVMPKEKKEEEDNPSLPQGAFLDRAADALFSARTVLIYGEVNTALARSVSAQLVALASSSDAPIRVLVHSQGGHVEAGDTIHDLVRAVAPDVIMIGTGWVASAGALIYSAAKKENRYALPNTRFLLHQPLGGAGGPASDIEIEATQILQMRERLNRIFAKATGQEYEKICRDTERNFWMNAKEAITYGLVNRVVDRLADIPSPRAS
ncbi:ATP-dependent Clp protease proteolytic subunit [Labilithrix luteola]|uniref:ATP-dependent Clp protease proteolytic subunit n=1 Tax=Labilithrix luteola TaxID=1391654 RepID=A0A0K1QAB0_9BACT|nr:ATP-dependent Clp protease proteolytic subunit [Labilithrix luteola]AKV02350.1 ATP-dependent Clp protease proteolytic subunit [Labilithrix luteola]